MIDFVATKDESLSSVKEKSRIDNTDPKYIV